MNLARCGRGHNPHFFPPFVVFCPCSCCCHRACLCVSLRPQLGAGRTREESVAVPTRVALDVAVAEVGVRHTTQQGLRAGCCACLFFSFCFVSFLCPWPCPVLSSSCVDLFFRGSGVHAYARAGLLWMGVHRLPNYDGPDVCVGCRIRGTAWLWQHPRFLLAPSRPVSVHRRDHRHVCVWRRPRAGCLVDWHRVRVGKR